MQLSYTIEEISALTGIGKTKLYAAINDGKLMAKKFGRRTLILKQDVDSFLAKLETYSSKSQKD